MVKYLLLFACASIEERRARDDLTVGHVEMPLYTIDVPGGLAHVRVAEADLVELRASCSGFEVRIDTSTALTLRITNLAPATVLSGAEVLRREGLSAELTITESTVVRATDARPGPFRFLAFGDIQKGITTFGDMIAAVNQEVDVDFILMLGDLSNDSRPEEMDAIEAAYAQIRFPIYATAGNHDVYDPDIYRHRFGRSSYQCAHRGAYFTAIDSTAAGLAPTVWTQLDGWLSTGAAAGHVMFSHIPATEASPARAGHWNSRREARHFVSRASDAGVDLLLFGHIHSLDAYQLGGIPTYISGGCGALPERLDGVGRHYLRIDYTDHFAVTPVPVDPE